MSRVVVIEKNKDGKIELTKEELQKMLDDAYTQGYTDGKGRYETITYPSYPFWYTTTDTIALNGTEVRYCDCKTTMLKEKECTANSHT